MKTNTRASILVDELESRNLLSGLFGRGFGFGGLGFPGLGLGGLGLGTTAGGTTSPAVTQDQQKLQTDQQKLLTDTQALAPKLLTDQAAILTAINNSSAVQTAQQKLQADQATWQTTLQGDIQAITSATDSTTRANALVKTWNDWNGAATALQGDQTAIQTAINTDPAVQAARTTLQNDQQTLVQDQANVQADLIQLQQDTQAQNGTNPGGSTGTGSMVNLPIFGFGRPFRGRRFFRF